MIKENQIFDTTTRAQTNQIVEFNKNRVKYINLLKK